MAGPAILVLEDGTVFEGQAIGAPGTRIGEIVFSTAMTGYQEMITDPSYRGQILTLTYPLIGNYGATEGDFESREPEVQGLIVKELCDHHSNWRAEQSVQDFLLQWGVPGIAGLDTRSLTRRLRTQGVMMGAISTDEKPSTLLRKILKTTNYQEIDFVREVSTRSAYQWNLSYRTGRGQAAFSFDQGARVVVVDYGLKYNILRNLYQRNCEAIVVPCDASAEEILSFHPTGVVLSPGPGNPELLGYAVETVRNLIGTLPIMGICLGHQVLGIAAGGCNYKLKFGHRGANHPVKDLPTGEVYITSQNHGFALDVESLTNSGLKVSQINLNDSTVEGMVHRSEPIFSIQYHPEASPGPHDKGHLFDQFLEIIGAAPAIGVEDNNAQA